MSIIDFVAEVGRSPGENFSLLRTLFRKFLHMNLDFRDVCQGTYYSDLNSRIPKIQQEGRESDYQFGSFCMSSFSGKVSKQLEIARSQELGKEEMGKTDTGSIIPN